MRQVFLARKADFDNKCQAAGQLWIKDKSWHSEVAQLFSNLNIAHLRDVPTASSLSKGQWKKAIKTAVSKYDRAQWLLLLDRTDFGKHYRVLKTEYGPEPYIFLHDRWSTCLKFYLRSCCYGLRSRMFHGDDAVDLKKCRLCTFAVPEDEAHYLLNCPAFTPERATFASQLETNLQTLFPHEFQDIASAPTPLQMAYLLGRTEIHWNAQVATIVDETVRPFLIALADKRKLLKANAN